MCIGFLSCCFPFFSSSWQCFRIAFRSTRLSRKQAQEGGYNSCTYLKVSFYFGSLVFLLYGNVSHFGIDVEARHAVDTFCRIASTVIVSTWSYRSLFHSAIKPPSLLSLSPLQTDRFAVVERVSSPLLTTFFFPSHLFFFALFLQLPPVS